MTTPKREALPAQARRSSQPWIHQQGQEIQSFGAVHCCPSHSKTMERRSELGS